MSEVQHTPGPWVVAPYTSFYTTVRAGNTETGRRIAETFCQGQPRTAQGALRTARENEANARVIAAAPDLLCEAEKAMAWFSKLTDWTGVGDPDIDGLRAAINKAKGKQS